MKRKRPGGERLRSGPGERGSVLMEGVLVLPIYLMMLGSLFILGDLARGRIKLLEIERFTTWIGGDRWQPAHAQDQILARLRLFVDTVTAPLEDIRLNPVRQEGKFFGNHWIDEVRGYGVLGVKVPYWMGMANAEQVVWHPEEGTEMTFQESYLLPGRTDGTAIRQYRSFLFRRLPEAEDEAFRRDRPDTLGIINETVWNVIWDSWGGAELHELQSGISPFKWTEYVRVNDMIAYGE